ncbi:16S rRNA (uracil(1498)-N(3))-methyltransferase [Microlunatus antarcticus]|uniref:Ribosomal RNA small subunit methyltransferase E n=1 Tax=Microlunatus antarcticus TaxID=53388 RepID=A0A7W5JX72_9ACTN|nr:16S rRNA (uracil1498-N3)-methyltransferase [Microlunatus antarcticus]
MTDALFLLESLAGTRPPVGGEVLVDGPEGHHAVTVRRLRAGDRVVVADGSGGGVRGEVVDATKAGLRVRVTEVLDQPAPPVRLVVAQALAKGDRAELAVEMLTEVGVAEVVPWQASRSIARWSADRVERGLGRWRSTAREAAKQSRRLQVPTVSEPVGTRALAERLAAADLALVLHEDATEAIARVALPSAGEVVIVVGPEGGISPEELTAFEAVGARTVRVGDHVLRTSTAGVVALAALINR